MEAVVGFVLLSLVILVAWLSKKIGHVPEQTQDFLEAVGRERLSRSDRRSWEGLKEAFHRDPREAVVADYRNRAVRHRWKSVSRGEGSVWLSFVEIALHGDLPSGFEARYPPKRKILDRNWDTFELPEYVASGPVDSIKWDPRIQLKADNIASLAPYMAGRESRVAAAILGLVQAGINNWAVEQQELRTADYSMPSQVLDPLVDLAEALDPGN